MWILALAAAAVVSAGPSGGETPTSAPVVGRAERCLASNVKRVLASEPDIEAAARFLVDFACAPEVARAARYERNLASIEAARALSASVKAQAGDLARSPASAMFDVSARVDPETGDIVSTAPPGARPTFLQGALPSMGDRSGTQAPWAVPAALRALAGRLVLEERDRSPRNGAAPP